jgi:hypothetical protein
VRHVFLAREHVLEALGRHVERVAERVHSAAQLHRPAQRHHRNFGIFHFTLRLSI